MSRVASLLVAIVLASSLTTLTTAASAEPRRGKPADAGPPQNSEAARLKSAGDALMDQDRYADALALYEKAYEQGHDPALLYNQGRALEALGDYPAALDKLEEFEKAAPPSLRAKVPGLHDLLANIRGSIGTLVVKTNAPSARLLVRDKSEGVVRGETRVRIRAGTASVEVTSEGYEPFRREVELSAGAELVIEANLVAKKRDALVVVRTNPTADVRLDGSSMGRSPLQFRVGPGSHEILATAPGYDDERIPMTLALGDRRDVDVELRKTPGVTSKWWFWTGIGVVVLGGVATAVALTTEKTPQSGTFEPGKVAAP